MSGTIMIAFLLAWAFALSFLLSGMEAGLPSLSRLRVRHLMRRGNASARVLQGFLDAPEDFLWTILVGNTLANFALLVGGLHLLRTWFGAEPWLMWTLLVPGAFALYALGDLLPKMLFQRYPNRLCLAVARPFRWLHLMLGPAVALVERLARALAWLTGGKRFTGRLFGSRDELRQLMQESAQSLDRDEQAMVNRVLDLQNLTVGSAMLPLDRVACVQADAPVSEFFRICREAGHERLPVRDPAHHRILGVVSLGRTLYRADVEPAQRVDAFLEPAVYLAEGVRLDAALTRLQGSGRRLAIVVDREQREVGILTLGDILKFLFGEVTL